MRLNQKLAVLSVLVLAGAACHHKDKVAPVPFPKATPTPVVVPNNPTPAPTPRTGEPIPELSEYERIRQMDITGIDQMGLLPDIYFDYDQADLREADKATLSRNGETLKNYDFLNV